MYTLTRLANSICNFCMFIFGFRRSIEYFTKRLIEHIYVWVPILDTYFYLSFVHFMCKVLRELEALPYHFPAYDHMTFWRPSNPLRLLSLIEYETMTLCLLFCWTFWNSPFSYFCKIWSTKVTLLRDFTASITNSLWLVTMGFKSFSCYCLSIWARLVKDILCQ